MSDFNNLFFIKSSYLDTGNLKQPSNIIYLCSRASLFFPLIKIYRESLTKFWFIIFG